MKRINWPQPGKNNHHMNKLASDTSIKLDPASQERTLEVRIISDAYIGMEWILEGVEVPAVPLVEGDDKKKPTS